MKLLFALTALILFTADADAAYRGGILIDSSSNMLMRPGGESGVYSLLYGEYSHVVSKKLMASYGIEGAFIERYNGLQYQRHDISVSYNILTKQNIAWTVSSEAGLSRFGDVTLIDGYEHGSLKTNIKSYLTPTLLLRGEGLVKLRSYKTYESENYRVAETSLRIDKFLESKTTFRFQADAGVRRYSEIESTPVTARYGFSSRIAQSFSDNTGISFDAHSSYLSSSSGDDEGTYVFNRIFLDDSYKYSSRGLSAQLRYIFPGKGTVTLKSNYDVRNYGKGSLESYDYLPEKGWKETEQGVSLLLAYRFAFIPERLHPTIELYHTDVEASENYLSYYSSGLSLRLSF